MQVQVVSTVGQRQGQTWGSLTIKYLLEFPSLIKGFGDANGLEKKKWRLSFEEEKEKMEGHSYVISYLL